MNKVLVVGQTPPPYHGQAIMTERLLKTKFEHLKLFHVRMSFSSSMSSVGKFKVWKLVHMLQIVLEATYKKLRYNVHTLYYMPGGSSRTPILRDIFILFFLRLIFNKTIFHFRSAGVSEIVNEQPFLIRKMAQFVYRKPNLAIQLSQLNPKDGDYFRAKRTLIIPNGLEDAAQPYLPIQRVEKDYVTILYVGLLNESKGVMILLQAVKELVKQDMAVKVNLVGEFTSSGFQQKVFQYIKCEGLEDIVNLPGVKKGSEKWAYFLEADIFCFPSFYESESFGNVVVEAMMFSLPVVATKWRGIPDLVKKDETGFLIPVKDVSLTSEALRKLITSSALRYRFGTAGRKRYRECFQLDSFMRNMSENMISIE